MAVEAMLPPEIAKIATVRKIFVQFRDGFQPFRVPA